jgi:hypothetical protein
MTKIPQDLIVTEDPIKKFPTSTSVLSRLGIFGPGFQRSSENYQKSYKHVCKNTHGEVTIQHVGLTQVHAKVLRGLMDCIEYKKAHDDLWCGRFSAKELLNYLNWEHNPQHFKLLEDCIHDLTAAIITMDIRTPNQIRIKNGFHILDSYQIIYRDVTNKDLLLSVRIAPQFENFYNRDTTFEYSALSQQINYLRKNGLIDSIVTYLLSQAFKQDRPNPAMLKIKKHSESTCDWMGWAGKLTVILEHLNITIQHNNPLTGILYKKQSIHKYLEDLRRIYNPTTKEFEENPIVKDLREYFEIYVFWESSAVKECYIVFDQTALEDKFKRSYIGQGKHAVVCKSPKKIERKPLPAAMVKNVKSTEPFQRKVTRVITQAIDQKQLDEWGIGDFN